MTSVTRPRGQLPARVYWVRRALVVVVLAVTSGLVVVGLAAFLGTGGDQPGVARQAAAGTEPSTGAASPGAEQTTADPTPSATPTATPSTKKERRAARRAEREAIASAVPEGVCEPRTVRISSRVSDAFAATSIEVPLEVITLGSVPCSWEFSADTVALDITSGDDQVWTSVQCPAKVPDEELVLVPGTSTTVTFTWNGQRSDRDCSRATDFAFPGWYHVLVAAEGGEPYDQQFELTKAPAEVETRTARPKPRARDDESAQAEAQTSGGAEGRTGTEGRDGD